MISYSVGNVNIITVTAYLLCFQFVNTDCHCLEAQGWAATEASDIVCTIQAVRYVHRPPLLLVSVKFECVWQICARHCNINCGQN